MRRRALLAALPLAACAQRAPAPALAQLEEGRLLVLSPTAEFDPQRLPSGWSRRGERGARFAVTTEAGRPVLSMAAPGGDVLVRALDGALVATAGLEWAWKLEPAAFGGGGGDGLPRGLRLVFGFAGGGSPSLIVPARWMRSHAGFPPHDRRIEIALAGAGVTRPELASVELSASAEDGAKRVLRPAATGLTGGWISEFVDLYAAYRGFFPGDRPDQVTFAFAALGALPSRLPEAIPDDIGHIVEVQLFR